MGKKLIGLTIVLLVLGPALAASATLGPVGWWKFDDGSGTTAVDSVGGLNGALLPADPNDPAASPQWVAGKIGGGVQLDGVDDYVELPVGDMVSGLSDTTVTCWVNWGGTGMWARLFDFGTGTNNYMFMCPQANTNQLRFAIRTAAVGEQVVSASTGTLPTGWHHVAVSINATTKALAMFQDGAQVGSGATTLLPKDLGVTTQNWIGKSQWPDPLFAGTVDEFRIYDRALAEDEVVNVLAGGPGFGLANTPVPANRATDVSRDAKLSFTAAKDAKTHDIYFGTDRDAVASGDASVLVSQNQKGTTFNPGRMELGATYYWRVDEIGGEPDFAVTAGNAWSFTVEPYAYVIGKASITATASSSNSDTMGPEKTIDGSGLNAADQHSTLENDMWLSSATGDQPTWIQYAFDKVYSLNEMMVWNSNQALEPIVGYGAHSVTIEYGVDPCALTTLGDFEFAQAAGDGQYTANTVVDFNGLPAQYVKLTINSNWGGVFPQYGLSEVRFSRFPVIASYPSPAPGTTGVDTSVTLSWRPGRQAASHEVYLSYNKDAVVNGVALAGKTSAPTFTAPVELNRTYYWKITEVNQAEVTTAWAGDVWSFSTVPYLDVDTPNRTLDYSKDVGIAPTVTDWTLGGAKTLVISFTGKPGNAPGQFFIRVGGTAYRFYIKMPDATKALRQQMNIDLAELTKQGINLKSVKGMTIGVLSEGSGSLVINHMRLYRDAPPLPTPANPGNKGLAALYAMEGNVDDSSGKGLNGTTTGDPVFVAGQAGYGQALSFDSVDDFATLPIGDLVSTLSNVTVATWVNFGGGGGWWQRVFDFGSGTNNYAFFCARVANNGTLRFAIRTPAVGEQTVNGPILPTDSWHHVALTMDASAMTETLWLDGIPAGTANTALLFKDMGVTTQNWLGKSQWPDALYLGSIDDFRIYDRALLEGEMRYLAGIR
jgi:hypothetical protein